MLTMYVSDENSLKPHPENLERNAPLKLIFRKQLSHNKKHFGSGISFDLNPRQIMWAVEKNKVAKSHLMLFRREDRIRTCDPLVPNQVRYRPALLPGVPLFKGGQK
jgi:hypothetical protein